jgi:hypothetical protein
MSTQLLGLVISAVGAILFISAAVGLPALAIICVRYLKLKERELVLEMEFRQKSQDDELAIEQRLRRIEAVLNLDQEPSRSELAEPPATPDLRQGQSLDPSRVRIR